MKTTESLSKQLGEKLLQASQKLAVAESCTGGLLSEAITAIPGSSQYFDRGFITYSNEAKHEMLQVPSETIETFGAVSKETAIAMLEGVLKNSHADIATAITGVAGPDGGTDEKPVGTVWIAWGGLNNKNVECCHFEGSRESVREQAVDFVLNELLAY